MLLLIWDTYAVITDGISTFAVVTKRIFSTCDYTNLCLGKGRGHKANGELQTKLTNSEAGDTETDYVARHVGIR